MICGIDDQLASELEASELGIKLESINLPPGLAAIGGLENALVGAREQNLRGHRVGHQYAGNSGRASHMSPSGSQVTGAHDRCIGQGRLSGILDGEIGRICRAGYENLYISVES